MMKSSNSGILMDEGRGENPVWSCKEQLRGMLQANGVPAPSPTNSRCRSRT
ncbi:hypothetical protein NDU88_008493, partial [Pleurodeles waltl]